MSKALALAAVYMGIGWGMKAYQYDLDDDTGYDDDMKLNVELARWAKVGVTMVDLAFSITMEYPQGYAHEAYRDFGDWFAEWQSEHDDNQWPSSADCHGQLIDCVINAFSELLNEQQQTRLRKLLQAVPTNF